MNFYINTRTTKMIARLAIWLCRVLFTLLLIIFITGLPLLYQVEERQFTISFSSYWESVSQYIAGLLQGDLGEYKLTTRTKYEGSYIISSQFTKNIDLALVIRFFWISARNFLLALGIGITLGLCLGAFSTLLRRKWRKSLDRIFLFLIAIPDFVLIVMMQLFAILVFKKFGIRLYSVASSQAGDVLLLPIFTLSIFPMIYTFRASVNSFRDVLTERYIQTAYSKGLSKWKIILGHVFKNGLPAVLDNMPSIVILTLSNLFIMEYLLNTSGVTQFIFFKYQYSIEVAAISVIMIYFMTEAILLLAKGIQRWISVGEVE